MVANTPRAKRARAAKREPQLREQKARDYNALAIQAEKNYVPLWLLHWVDAMPSIDDTLCYTLTRVCRSLRLAALARKGLTSEHVDYELGYPWARLDQVLAACYNISSVKAISPLAFEDVPHMFDKFLSELLDAHAPSSAMGIAVVRRVLSCTAGVDAYVLLECVGKWTSNELLCVINACKSDEWRDASIGLIFLYARICETTSCVTVRLAAEELLPLIKHPSPSSTNFFLRRLVNANIRHPALHGLKKIGITPYYATM